MLNGIKPLCLTLLLLLSACHSASVRPPPRRHGVCPYRSYQVAFPLDKYSQSVDKWLPPARSGRSPCWMTLRSNVIFLPSNPTILAWGRMRSPLNPHYIASVLSREAESHRDAAMDKYLGNDSVSWGKLQDPR